MKKFFGTLGIIFLILITSIVFIAYKSFFAKNIFPEKNKFFFVSKGMKYDDVIKILKQKKIIQDNFYFSIALKVFPIGGNFRIGKYSISSRLNNVEIIKLLRSGGAIVPITVVIPPGTTIKQQAKIFRKNLEIDSSRFVNLVFDKKFISKFNIDANSLEGYLYPANYELMWQMNEETILETQVKKIFSVIDEKILQRAEKIGLNMHELLTLASIVQGETRLESEMPRVAGVYPNRLKKGIYLQADPTIQYIIPDSPRRLFLKDYKIPSLFNTYLHKGLPPTPINNPTKKYIDAVLNYEKHNYLFFVYNGIDGHTFTRTYAEHLVEVRKLREFLKEKAKLSEQ